MFISGRHCEVRFEKGGYWLYDVSRNGTFLNGSAAGEEPLPARQRRPAEDRPLSRFRLDRRRPARPRGRASPFAAAPRKGDNIWDTGGPAPPPIDRRELMPPQNAASAAPISPSATSSCPDQSPPLSSCSPPATPAAPPPRPTISPAPPRRIARMPPPSRSLCPGACAESPSAAAAAAPPAAPGPPSAASPSRAAQSSPPAYLPPPAVPQPPRPPAPPGRRRPCRPGGRRGDPARHRGRRRRLALVFLQRDPSDVAAEIGAVLRTVVEELAILLKARAAAKLMAKAAIAP